MKVTKMKEKNDVTDYANLITKALPKVKQYPLTIECKVLYAQDQDLPKIPEDIREKTYANYLKAFLICSRNFSAIGVKV